MDGTNNDGDNQQRSHDEDSQQPMLTDTPNEPRARSIPRPSKSCLLLVSCMGSAVILIALQCAFIPQGCNSNTPLNFTANSRKRRDTDTKDDMCKIQIQTRRSKLTTDFCLVKNRGDDLGFEEDMCKGMYMKTECLCFGFISNCKQQFYGSKCIRIKKYCETKKLWDENSTCNCVNNRMYIKDLSCNCTDERSPPHCVTEIETFACKLTTTDVTNYTECKFSEKEEPKCKYQNAEKNFLCQPDTNVKELKLCNSTNTHADGSAHTGILEETNEECALPHPLAIAVIVLPTILVVFYSVCRIVIKENKNRDKYLLCLAGLSIFVDLVVAVLTGMMLQNSNITTSPVFISCSFIFVLLIFLITIESLYCVWDYMRTVCRREPLENQNQIQLCTNNDKNKL